MTVAGVAVSFLRWSPRWAVSSVVRNVWRSYRQVCYSVIRPGTNPGFWRGTRILEEGHGHLISPFLSVKRGAKLTSPWIRACCWCCRRVGCSPSGRSFALGGALALPCPCPWLEQRSTETVYIDLCLWHVWCQVLCLW